MMYKVRMRLGFDSSSRVVRFRIEADDFHHSFGALHGEVLASVIKSYVSPRTYARLKSYIVDFLKIRYFCYEVISIDYVD